MFDVAPVVIHQESLIKLCVCIKCHHRVAFATFVLLTSYNVLLAASIVRVHVTELNAVDNIKFLQETMHEGVHCTLLLYIMFQNITPYSHVYHH